LFLTGVQIETPPAWMPVLVSQVKKIKSWSFTNTSTLSGVETTYSEACAYGGSMNISLNDANNNNEPDAGDSVSLSFDNCAISYSERISGSMSFVINSISDGNYSAADISINLDNFSVVSGNTAATAEGDMRLSVQEFSNRSSFYFISNSLRSTSTVSGVANAVRVTNFSMTVTDAYTAADEVTYQGTLTLSSFSNQSVVVSTISPWLIGYGAAYPHAGQMILTGQAGAKIRITAVSSTNVRLELDASGDGVYENSKVVTWASFE
jgi:hypothetical protein